MEELFKEQLLKNISDSNKQRPYEYGEKIDKLK